MSLTIGWFTTAEDTKAHDLFTNTYNLIQSLGLDVNIAYLFCNRQEGEDPKTDQFLASVKDLGINLITHSSQEFQKGMRSQTTGKETDALPDWQQEYHNQVVEKISYYPIDIALLVGYTPAVTAEFIKKYTTLKFRPALPNGPSGTWPTIIWQLIGTRSAETGVTVHLLTEEDTDRGIPVAYCNYPIKKREFSSFWQDLDRKMKSHSLAQLIATEGENVPLFNAIKEAGEDLEIPLITLTIQDLLSGVIKFEDQKQVYCNNELQPSGCCLTREVEKFLIDQEEDEVEDEEDDEDEGDEGDDEYEGDDEDEGDERDEEFAEEEVETL